MCYYTIEEGFAFILRIVLDAFFKILIFNYGDNDKMKKTKIICTLGPATDNPQILEKMILSGMNVARFNFSHGAYEDHEKRLKEVIAVREKLNAPVATLLVLKVLRFVSAILKIPTVLQLTRAISLF